MEVASAASERKIDEPLGLEEERSARSAGPRRHQCVPPLRRSVAVLGPHVSYLAQTDQLTSVMLNYR